MKKIWSVALALTMILAVLCTACGGNTEEKPSAEKPANDTLPSVTAPPAGEEADKVGLAAEENSAPEQVSRGDWLATLCPEQRLVEEELIGATVEELYDAIGEPESAVYTASCLVSDGQDGVLTYDGFIVSTTKMANGVEYVMGTDN